MEIAKLKAFRLLWESKTGSTPFIFANTSLQNKEKDSPYVKLVKHWVCEGNDELFKDLEKYEAKGSEGLMLRKPGSFYERKRSKTLYKIKSFYDSEAKVLSYIEGKGRLKGMKCGVMVVKALYEIKNNRFKVDFLKKIPGSLVWLSLLVSIGFSQTLIALAFFKSTLQSALWMPSA